MELIQSLLPLIGIAVLIQLVVSLLIRVDLQKPSRSYRNLVYGKKIHFVSLEESQKIRKYFDELEELASELSVSIENIINKRSVFYQQELKKEIEHFKEKTSPMNRINMEVEPSSDSMLSDEAHEAAIIKSSLSTSSDVILSLSNTMRSSSFQLKEALDRNAKVMNIASVVSTLAEQTNLLAFNAAIEAARAGENGRGFAVVADEVRSLAVQSSSAAQHITNGLEAANVYFEQLANEMIKQSEKAESISSIALDAEQAIANLTEKVSLFSHETARMTNLAKDQREAMRNIQELVVANIKIAEETATESKEMELAFREILMSFKRQLKRYPF